MARLLATAVALGAAIAGCGGHEDSAPAWVKVMVRQEATRLGEPNPEIDFVGCGPATCIVRLTGSFRDPSESTTRPARLDLELSIRPRAVTERAFYYHA